MPDQKSLNELFQQALIHYHESELDESRLCIDSIIERDPFFKPALDLWKQVDSTRKEQELPYIFPANLGKAQTVDGIYGCLSPGDIRALRFCARAVQGTCVNIGMFNGLSPYVLAKANPELRVVGIDAFPDRSAQVDQRNTGQEKLARRNLARVPNAELLAGLSQDLAVEWDDPIDFLFIGGDYTVEGAARDFEAWSPFLKEGGYLALHGAYGRISESIYEVRKSTGNHGPDVLSQGLSENPDYEFQLVNGCTEVWKKAEKQKLSDAPVKLLEKETAQSRPQASGSNRSARFAPETCIVFVSFGRPAIADKSLNSLLEAVEPVRNRVRIILSDATNDAEKMAWASRAEVDDVILTPRFTPAATSRNLAATLILDKYAPRYLCFLEDDFLYTDDWYPSLVDAADRLYGVLSPFDLAYGIFSACDFHIPAERKKPDPENGVTAYIFGSVAYQRFMPTAHYLQVMRMWDPDMLGISYAQTGGQTFRNTMRGFCGAVLQGGLSSPIDEDSSASTWSKGKRHPGPPAHSFKLDDYTVIQQAAKKAGYYVKDET